MTKPKMTKIDPVIDKWMDKREDDELIRLATTPSDLWICNDFQLGPNRAEGCLLTHAFGLQRAYQPDPRWRGSLITTPEFQAYTAKHEKVFAKYDELNDVGEVRHDRGGDYADTGLVGKIQARARETLAARGISVAAS